MQVLVLCITTEAMRICPSADGQSECGSKTPACGRQVLNAHQPSLHTCVMPSFILFVLLFLISYFADFQFSEKIIFL